MALYSSEGMARLVGLANDAATGARAWDAVLGAMAVGLGVDLTTIEILDKRTGRVRTAVHGPISEAATREYEEHVFRVNPRLAVPDPKPFQLIANRHVPAEVDAAAGEFHDWVHRHRQCPWFAGGLLFDDRDYFAICSTQNMADRGAADAETEAAVRHLMPHLANALRVEQALATTLSSDQERRILMGQAFVLLDCGGNVLIASDAFRHVVSRLSALSLTRSTLAAERTDDRARLAAMIRAAIAADPLKPPHPVRIAPDGPGQGVLLRAVSLTDNRLFFDRIRPAALIVLIDLDAPAAAGAAELQSVWGLSEREAEVALLVGRGHAPDQAAALLGISSGTLRHHLKSIFRRMGIERQVDLVRIVERLSRGR